MYVIDEEKIFASGVVINSDRDLQFSVNGMKGDFLVSTRKKEQCMMDNHLRKSLKRKRKIEDGGGRDDCE
jgi:hypothetical protein